MKNAIAWALLCPALMVLVAAAAPAQNPGALAPILVEPYDGKDVVAEQIVWSWFMQSRAADGEEIFCDLVVVEIVEGQTAEEAMRLNPPAILRRELTTSSWQTPPSVRELQHGRRYTWQITAKVRRGTGFRIVSRSELWEFTYNDPAVVVASAIADTARSAPLTGMERRGTGTLTTGEESATVDSDREEGEVPRPIEISGTARHISASENRRGTLSATPVRFDRVQIDPTVTLFGVPLDLSLLLTTEGDARGSDISRGAFGSQNVRNGINLAVRQRVAEEISNLEARRDSALVDTLRAFAAADSATIAERIAQLEQIANDGGDGATPGALQELNLLTPEQRTIAQFPGFGFGKVAPSFGSLLLNGVTLNGGLIEYNPGNLYIAASAGKAGREIDPSALPVESGDSLVAAQFTNGGLEFFRNIYAARVGYGRRDRSYVALTALYAEDDEASRALQSIINRPSARLVELIDSTGEVVGVDTVVEARRVIGRQRNYGFGGVGRLEQRTLGLTLDGEFNLMYFDDDANRSAQTLIPLPRALPGFLRSDSSLVDFNFALRSDWQLPESELGRISGGIRYVGGGFRSVGTAGLRTDVLRADARYSNLLLDQQLRVGANYSFEEAGYKDSSNTSRINALGVHLDLRLRGLPTLGVVYQRHSQRLETGKRDTARQSRTENGIEQVSATVTWLRQWEGGRWSVFASATLQNGTSEGDGERFQPDSVGIFRTRTLQLDNRLGLGSAVTLGALVAWSGTRNHPTRTVFDSTGERTTSTAVEENDAYSIDISTLLYPAKGVQFTLGGVATWQGEIPQPTILGGYLSGRYEVGTVGTVELRFDYRESGVPALAGAFPVERVGRIITSVRW